MKYSFSPSSFIIGVMIGILFAGVYILGDNFTPLSMTQSSPSTTNTSSSVQESDAVSISNQPPGDTVTIESVTVPPPGVWIAVREVNDDGLGNVLGAARVNGPRTAISVSLLRATDTGHSYAVELYRDDNNGEFNPSVNSVYVDFTTGAPVIAYFKATD